MNRLSHETSPYLLQHQHNPVDWCPWDAAALARAKAEDKPIFLSIGYAACHWCHVMEHESFEDPRIAALLNQHFVCIKVDREERPDLDHIYMQAVQLIAGRGGWPLSVFLTPDLQPFYGGTYWPPAARMGMPGFDEVLLAVADAWLNRRGLAVQQAMQLTTAVASAGHEANMRAAESERWRPSAQVLEGAKARLSDSFDPVHGGFSSAPKFPRPIELQLLLRIWQRDRSAQVADMVSLTLDKMAAGGMYDHLGGGFARYSVDDRWLVPHFEKMLYDNALLADAYLDGYLVSKNPQFRQTVIETLDYILRDMLDAEGGFHGTEDADSEGEEGKFYVWSAHDIMQELGRHAGGRFCHVYGVTPAGNFEGKNILHRQRPIEQAAAQWSMDPVELMQELAQSREKLRQRRGMRVRPGKDDKILVSWNGLMIHTLSRAAGALQRADYLAAAQRAAHFLLAELRREDGRLWHYWRRGQAKLSAYLDDYANLTNALVTLYESDFDERWIEQAIGLSEIMLAHFQDRDGGGFFFTADHHEKLVARTKEWLDASVPGSNAMAATAFIRLGKLTGRSDLLEAALKTLQAAAPLMRQVPEAMGQMLVAADLLAGPTWEIALVAPTHNEATGRILESLRTTFIPRRVVAFREASGGGVRASQLDPLFAGKSPYQGQPTAYACEGFACQEPQAGESQILALWQELAER